VIRAVTLDGWGTVLLDGPGSDERYRQQRLRGFTAILAAAGVGVRAARLEHAYVASGRRLAGIWHTNRDVPVREHVLAIVDAIDPALGGQLSEATLAALVEAYASPALRVPPAVDAGAKTALAALRARGLALALISNTMRTPGVVLRQILDGAGLLGQFSVVTFSDECGIRKPDPQIFLRTLREVGVSPEEAVHVGDDPVLDVEGARDARMAGVIQVTADRRAKGSVAPDAVIAGLEELPAALSQLRS
jgi:putative hydrolase of the HAD superfamily